MLDIAIAGFAVALIGIVIWYNSKASMDWHDDPNSSELGKWHGKFFYINKKDKRIFLPKRSGGGYTLNLGNPFTLILAALSIVVILSLIV